MKYYLSHAHLIVDGNREFLNGGLLINDGHIEELIQDVDAYEQNNEDYYELNLKGLIVMPGFFDTHIHGTSGVDFDKASLEDFDKVSLALAKQGTTSSFYTLTPSDDLYERLEKLKDYEAPYARFQGIHMEGPFLSEVYPGVLNKERFIKPSKEVVDELLSHNENIKNITFAIEKDEDGVSEYLRSKNVRVMLGHSNAHLSDINDNFDGFTHLYNAMSPFTHRNLGLVNVAFMMKDKYAELIADGNHIERAVLKVTYDNLHNDRIVLISDSTAMNGMEDGEYEFQNDLVIKKGTCLNRVKDGRFAGSVCSIKDCVKVMHEIGVDNTDLLLMSSLNAFRLYGLDNKYGTLEKGKYADLNILDKDMNLICTMVNGKFINA